MAVPSLSKLKFLLGNLHISWKIDTEIFSCWRGICFCSRYIASLHTQLLQLSVIQLHQGFFFTVKMVNAHKKPTKYCWDFKIQTQHFHAVHRYLNLVLERTLIRADIDHMPGLLLRKVTPMTPVPAEYAWFPLTLKVKLLDVNRTRPHSNIVTSESKLTATFAG